MIQLKVESSKKKSFWDKWPCRIYIVTQLEIAYLGEENNEFVLDSQQLTNILLKVYYVSGTV